MSARRRSLAVGLLCSWMAFGVAAVAAELGAAPSAQRRCPITGAELNAARPAPFLVESGGFVFAVADAGAAAKALADPVAAFAALAANGDDAVAFAPFFACPVTGRPATRVRFARRDGRRVYGCSEACVGAMEKAWPDAVAKAASTKPAQSQCPITGTSLVRFPATLVVELDGFRFLVAAPDAAEKAKADPAAAFAALAKRGEAAVPISQACPVMGNRVDKAVHVTRDGRRVFLCCKGCVARTERNWDATLTKLAERAVQGDPAPMPTM